jgi:hypothetical protein
MSNITDFAVIVVLSSLFTFGILTPFRSGYIFGWITDKYDLSFCPVCLSPYLTFIIAFVNVPFLPAVFCSICAMGLVKLLVQWF